MWISCNLVVDLLQVEGALAVFAGVSDADPDTLLLFGLVSKVPRTDSSLLLALGIFLLSSSVASSSLQIWSVNNQRKYNH